MTHEEIVEDHVNDIMHDAESYVADYSNKEWFKARLTSALTTYRAQVLEEGKQKCEVMLDKEAERVAKSILQLVGSIKFKVNDVLDPEVPKEAIHTANKLAFAIKEILTKEITQKFIHPTN